MLKISNGDYVSDRTGGFCRLKDEEALAQQIWYRLSARRGALPFLPELGSRFYLLGRAKPSEREMLARQYAAEALKAEQVRVVNTAVQERGDGGLDVEVWIEKDGIQTAVSVTAEGRKTADENNQ